MPALHHAVLDHQAHAALAGVVHERREDALGLAQVVRDAAAGVAADERAHGHAAERGGGVDARAQVRVVRLALGGVGVQVVVVVGERGEHEPVAVEGRAHAVGLRVVERVGRHVAGRERAVAEPRPGGELERLVAVGAGPGGDVLEAALGHARAQEAELHRGHRLVRGGHVDPLAARRRRQHGLGDAVGAQPVGEQRQAVGRLAGLDGLVEVRHEGVEAVRVALGMAAWQGRVASRRGRQRFRVAPDDRLRRPATRPQLLRLLLVEGERLLRAVDLDPEPVLAPGGDLADHDRAERAGVRLELDDRGVLGAHRAAAPRCRRRPRRRARRSR